MKTTNTAKILVSAGLGLTAWLPGRLGAQATPLADATALRHAVIEGSVMRADNGQPLPGARINLARGGASVVADGSGRFRIADVIAGPQTLSIAHADCAPVRFEDLVVRPGQTLALGSVALVWAHPADQRREEYVVDGSAFSLVLPYKYWTVDGPLLDRGAARTFDDVGVKNPSIVQHHGRWHLFYTSKPAQDAAEFKTALGYVTAPTLEGLRTAPRVEMRKILGESIIAPQVFYFAPQQRWYLIGHMGDAGLHILEPVYSTNTDIGNVPAWSSPRRLAEGVRRTEELWIDFWVICDDLKAHLFYADQSGALYRLETPLADFPQGFGRAPAQKVIVASGRNARGEWIFYDAAHIYWVKSAKKYFALLEGAYAHPTRKNYWDGRNRFLFAMTAERLEGPWQRVEANKSEFLGEARWLFDAAGNPVRFDSVSHPELIRAGSDHRLELEDFRLQMVFQTFDATGIPPSYDYHALPWQLMFARNY